ncbi:hypothetical protein PGB90_006112 [Kerria lacca]
MIRESEIERPRTVESSTSPTRWVQNWSPGLDHSNYEVAYDIDLDLQYHIQHCPCTCNHLGYGNYLDYQAACGIENENSSVVHCTLDERRTHCNGSIQRTISRVEELNCSAAQNSYKNYEFQLRPCIIGIGVAMVIIIICLVISACISESESDLPSSSSLGPEGRLDVVRAILQEVPLVDGHNDLPWNLKKFVHNQLYKVNLSADLRFVEPWSKSKWSHTDLQRMKIGMVGAQFWSAFVPCETQYKNAVTLTLEQIDVIKRFVKIYKDELEFVTSAAGVREAHKRGRIASLIGLEGGHSLGDSLGVLRMYYDLGVRYLTLTHKCDTLWASCCVVGNNPAVLNGTGKVRGLTLFGQGIVREMNRLGMLVDLSHTSVHTMEDALNVTRAPVIFSHASAYAICNSNRNVPDHILKKVALNGGVVMVTFYPYFISCDTASTMNQVIAHINHIRDVAGEDHVGLGSGYDGINYTTSGLEDVSHFPDLLNTLIVKHNWTQTQMKKLVGLNVLRVFQKVEKIRDELKNELLPDEDTILAHYHYKKLPHDCAVHDL